MKNKSPKAVSKGRESVHFKPVKFIVDPQMPSNTPPSQVIHGTWRPGEPDHSLAESLQMARVSYK